LTTILLCNWIIWSSPQGCIHYASKSDGHVPHTCCSLCFMVESIFFSHPYVNKAPHQGEDKGW